MDIVACTDSGFVMPTGVMMYSVCVNNQNSEIIFHVVTNGVPTEDKKKLRDTVTQFSGKTIIFYDVDKLDLSVIPPKNKIRARLTLAAYYRLFITELLPSNLKKILYLDGDIIVRQSLSPLWETNIENFAVAAITDTFNENREYYERLGYPMEKGYFNSGVMLINLEYWRTNNLLLTFTNYMKQHADCIVAYDQDVLNYTLCNCKKVLPVKFNLQTDFLVSNMKYESERLNQQIKEAIDDCVILHFTRTNPWYTTCQHPYRSSFFKYQLQTVWANSPLIEKRPITWRIKKKLGWVFRYFHLLPELPPYGNGFIKGLKPMD